MGLIVKNYPLRRFMQLQQLERYHPLTNKVLSKSIQERLTEALEQYIREEQAGFRKGKSCSDHIYTLRQILDQSTFGSLHRESLWSTTRHYGIPSKLVNIINMLCTDFSAKVICSNSLIYTFEIKTGVKQGCILSPFMFMQCRQERD